MSSLLAGDCPHADAATIRDRCDLYYPQLRPWARSTASITPAAVSASVAVWARPLQRLRQRPFELFKLPAVN